MSSGKKALKKAAQLAAEENSLRASTLQNTLIPEDMKDLSVHNLHYFTLKLSAAEEAQYRKHAVHVVFCNRNGEGNLVWPLKLLRSEKAWRNETETVSDCVGGTVDFMTEYFNEKDMELSAVDVEHLIALHALMSVDMDTHGVSELISELLCNHCRSAGIGMFGHALSLPRPGE